MKGRKKMLIAAETLNRERKKENVTGEEIVARTSKGRKKLPNER